MDAPRIGDRPPPAHPHLIQSTVASATRRSELLPTIARDRPADLGGWIQEATRTAGYLATLDRPTDELRGWVELVRDLVVARFAIAVAGAPTVVRLAGARCEAGAYAGGAFADTGEWARGWYAAAILGDAEAQAALAAVPHATLRNANVAAEPIDLLHVELLCAVAAGDAPTAVARAAETAASVQSPARAGWIGSILLPAQACLIAAATGAPLEGPLSAALKAHRAFWTHGRRGMDPEGWIAWPLWSAVLLAEHGGATVTVRSDYLPDLDAG